MFTTIPEILRKNSINSLFNTATFKKCWETWRPNIKNILGESFSENDIINLGDELSSIFKTTGGAGREQNSLSAGGTAWESLVCWYINLCTCGSRIVAIKKMSLVPSPLQDAITVNYGNFACNTESDITIIIFPQTDRFTTELISSNSINVNHGTTQIFRKGKLNEVYLKHCVEQDFKEMRVGIIQCKTNWNDNAQIPMLWDMIYSANGFPGRNISIGRNGFSIQGLAGFNYAFVTVPSNKMTSYKSDSVSVKRVTNLSGGNFWGNKTTSNIARSIKEIFTNNYASGFNIDLRNDLRSALPYLKENSYLSYFNL